MFAKHCALVLERVVVYSKRESCLEKAKREEKYKSKKKEKNRKKQKKEKELHSVREYQSL